MSNELAQRRFASSCATVDVYCYRYCLVETLQSAVRYDAGNGLILLLKMDQRTGFTEPFLKGHSTVDFPYVRPHVFVNE